MRDPRFAARVMTGLKHCDGTDYLLHAAVVMPNHAHAVITLNPDTEMEVVTHGWKSPTAHVAVSEFGHAKPFWQKESYDHIVRHEGELRAVKRYIVNNPVKANLVGWPWVYELEESE